MDIREYILDILLILLLLASTFVFVSTENYDPASSTALIMIMLSFAGLMLLLHHKLRIIERGNINREKMIRVNLEEISIKMAQRYDSTVSRIDQVVEEFGKRVYR